MSEDAVNGLRARATTPPQGGTSGLTQHLTSAAHQWRTDLEELTARRDAVDAELPEFRRRAASPAATDDDRRALRIAKGSRKLLGAQINSITTDYWISVLERYGVLPNYTLLDDTVTLDVGVTWIDPDSGNYMGDSLSYQRGSRVALTELAPGATFTPRDWRSPSMPSTWAATKRTSRPGSCARSAAGPASAPAPR